MTLPQDITADRSPLTSQPGAAWAGQPSTNGWPTLPPVNRADRPPVSPPTDRLTGPAPTEKLTGETDAGQPVAGQPVSHTPDTPAGQPVSPAATARRVARDSGPLWLLGLFYIAMAGISLYGQTDGIVKWRHLRPLALPLVGGDIPARALALGPAAALELFAAVLFTFADWRRSVKHERALAIRAFAVIVAGGVAYLNFVAHSDAFDRTVFVGASLAAFVVVVAHTNARRRDAHGQMTKQAGPDYGAIQWVSQPRLTALAHRLAVADERHPLGRTESLRLARQQMVRQQEHARLVEAVKNKIAKRVDGTTAQLAVASLDLDAIARQLAATADNRGMAALLAADLTPQRLTQPDETDKQAGNGAAPSTTPTPHSQPAAPRPTRRRRPARRAAAHRQATQSVVTERVPESASDGALELETEARPVEADTNVVALDGNNAPKFQHGLTVMRRWLAAERAAGRDPQELPSDNDVARRCVIGKGTARKVKEYLMDNDMAAGVREEGQA